MFKCLVIFTKTMAGLIILATGLRGYNLLMLKANMQKDDTVIQSNVEVMESDEISVPDNNKTEESNNQNIPNNSTTNVIKEEKKTISDTKTNETTTQNNVSKNNTTTAQVKIDTNQVNEQKNIQNNNSNAQNKTKEKQTEVQQPQVQKEEQKPVQEVVQQPVREVKRNDEMIQKIKTYISTHETERMKKYGYSFVVDPDVVKITNPFTYSEFNMNSCLNRTGEYRIYAQDYYYNGKYVETQCFVY